MTAGCTRAGVDYARNCSSRRLRGPAHYDAVHWRTETNVCLRIARFHRPEMQVGEASKSRPHVAKLPEPWGGQHTVFERMSGYFQRANLTRYNALS
jgi:hypothetical protein